MRDVDAIHARFSALRGSRQIASRFACRGLAWWLQRTRPRTICEIGAGIGTLSAVIVRAAPYADTVFVEPDAWCRCRWVANVQHRGYPVEAMPRRPSWPDFLVIDGGDAWDGYYANLPPRATVFFEGRRRPQRAVLEAMWRGGRQFCWAEFKPWDRSKGYAAYQFDPTSAERVRFALVRAREWLLDRAWAGLGLPVGKKRVA